ncbi:hypothetical protein PN466_23565 [Roseofilum reptotaenium CS-1145]|nr:MULTISPECIES: hypothetical protein [Roseofilum]MDB9519927.1 hypothetical protein [Roseofilum reptotaenium CS-1145]
MAGNRVVIGNHPYLLILLGMLRSPETPVHVEILSDRSPDRP